MFDKLEAVEKRYEELNQLISDPEVISRQNEWKNLMKEHSDMIDIVEKYREYKKVKQALDEAQEMLSDKDLKDLAEMQMLECKENIAKIEEELKILLIPKDKDDEKILFVKSVEELEEKKLLYLRVHYLECILCMQKEKDGN